MKKVYITNITDSAYQTEDIIMLLDMPRNQRRYYQVKDRKLISHSMQILLTASKWRLGLTSQLTRMDKVWIQ